MKTPAMNHMDIHIVADCDVDAVQTDTRVGDVQSTKIIVVALHNSFRFLCCFHLGRPKRGIDKFSLN